MNVRARMKVTTTGRLVWLGVWMQVMNVIWAISHKEFEYSITFGGPLIFRKI